MSLYAHNGINSIDRERLALMQAIALVSFVIFIICLCIRFITPSHTNKQIIGDGSSGIQVGGNVHGDITNKISSPHQKQERKPPTVMKTVVDIAAILSAITGVISVILAYLKF